MVDISAVDRYRNKIICGDSQVVLGRMPDNSVDIVITSPPYNHLGSARNRAKGWSTASGMYKNNSWRQKVVSGQVFEDSLPENEYQQWLSQIISECLRVAKGLVWVNHKIRYRDGKGIHPLSFLPFPIYSEIVWNRGGSMALNCKRFAPAHDYIYGFGKAHYWDDDANRFMSVWNIAPKRDDGAYGHPCPFPCAIPLRLIHASCPDNGIVLDPFAGIGTTAVAAKILKREYIGIEINQPYCDIAQTRLADMDRQQELF